MKNTCNSVQCWTENSSIKEEICTTNIDMDNCSLNSPKNEQYIFLLII
jgi:hypothetical protein